MLSCRYGIAPNKWSLYLPTSFILFVADLLMNYLACTWNMQRFHTVVKFPSVSNFLVVTVNINYLFTTFFHTSARSPFWLSPFPILSPKILSALERNFSFSSRLWWHTTPSFIHNFRLIPRRGLRIFEPLTYSGKINSENWVIHVTLRETHTPSVFKIKFLKCWCFPTLSNKQFTSRLLLVIGSDLSFPYLLVAVLYTGTIFVRLRPRFLFSYRRRVRICRYPTLQVFMQ